jgi:hypothetical protein
MSDFLPLYQKVDPTTWAYLSSLLIIVVFFMFRRFWSVRNLDVVLLILLAPGLILAQRGIAELIRAKKAADQPAKVEAVAKTEAPPLSSAVKPESKPLVPSGPPNVPRGYQLVRWGFLLLLAVSLVWLIRLLLDPTMVRRPLLEPNLSAGGMLFMCTCLFLFLAANVAIGKPEVIQLETRGAVGAGALLEGKQVEQIQDAARQNGPGYYLLHMLPRIATRPFLGDEAQGERADIVTAKVIAILSQLAIVAGMIVIGYWHFDNIRMGIGAATLYLMLPYTAQMTGHVDHALPAALILWAVVLYRYPLYAGMLIGLGMGTSYFALYLLPLWISFYWQRGLGRFVIGVVGSLAVLTGVLALTSDSPLSFWHRFQAMFGLYWPMAMTNLDGIWHNDLPGHWAPEYRIPIFAVFVVLCSGFAVWPAQKNLGTLLSCSAAVMVATQFWQGFGSGHGGDGGGMFMAWYLPLALLSVFRPNLEDRVALTVLGEGWFPRRRMLKMHLERAA